MAVILKTVVLAVSGGVDLWLRFLMNQVVRQYNHLQLVTLQSLHCNQTMRSSLCYEIVAEYGIYFCDGGEPTATTWKLAARDAQYQFSQKWFGQLEAGYILMTAHHLNDVLRLLMRSELHSGLQVFGLLDEWPKWSYRHANQWGPLQHCAVQCDLFWRCHDHFVRNRGHTYIPQLMQEQSSVTTSGPFVATHLKIPTIVQYADYLNLEPQLLMYSTNHYYCWFARVKFNMYLRIFLRNAQSKMCPLCDLK